MKYSIFALAFVAALGAAQTSDGIPSCATACVNKYTTGTEIAGCKQLDVACICKNEDFLNGIACCLSTACDQAGQQAAVQYAKQICSSQGVSTPDQVVCKQASGSASGSAASSTGSSAAATQSPTGTQTSAGAQTSAGTQTSASPKATTSNAAPGLSGAGSLVGAALAMLAAL